MLDLLDNASLQGLGYAAAVVGIALAFRVLKYPDLTADGSFMVGATAYAGALLSGWPELVAVVAGLSCGALAGLVTAGLAGLVGVNRLLSGILTSMLCYSISIRILGGSPNANLLGQHTFLDVAAGFDRQAGAGHLATLAMLGAIVLAAAGILAAFLRSDAGLLLRAAGANASLVSDLGRRPEIQQALGLTIANALVALSGVTVAARQGFVDVNMGVGIVIVIVAALIIGEQLLTLIGFRPDRSIGHRLLGAVLGSVAYFALYLLILRASIRGWLPLDVRPTDLKMLSAVLVITAHLVRKKSTIGREELLPL